MKRIGILLVLLMTPCLLSAQNVTDANGLKQGVWSKTYPWGSLRYEGAFEDDKEVGVFRFYDQNGKVISERQYESPGGISNAVMYMPNGNLEALGQFDGKQKIGQWKYFSTRGHLVSTEDYTLGLKEGEERIFYADSTLAEVIHWASDKKEGAWLKCGATGNVLLKAFYALDQLHGTYISYYPSSKKKTEGQYKKGLKHGKWFYYSEKGVQEKMEVYEYGDLYKTVLREGDKLTTINHRKGDR